MPPASAELLTRRLDDHLAGLVTLDDCLAADPGQAAELRGLVEVVRAIAPPPPVTPDPAFRRRARVALLEAIEAGRSPAAGRARLRSLATAAGGLIMPPRNHVARAAAPAIFVALLLVLAAGGAVDASQGALPGDRLYPVKLGAEEVRLALAADDEARARVHLELASRRADEIEQARAAGRPDAAATATDAFAEHVGSAERLMTNARDAGHDVGALADLLAASSSRQATPTPVQPGVPGPAAAPADAGPAVSGTRGSSTAPADAREATTPSARPASPSGSGGPAADPSSGRRPTEVLPPPPTAAPTARPTPIPSAVPTARPETRGPGGQGKRATPSNGPPAEESEAPAEQLPEPRQGRAPGPPGQSGPPPPAAQPAPPPASQAPGQSGSAGNGGGRPAQTGPGAGGGGGPAQAGAENQGGGSGQSPPGGNGGGRSGQASPGDNGGGRPSDGKSSKHP